VTERQWTDQRPECQNWKPSRGSSRRHRPERSSSGPWTRVGDALVLAASFEDVVLIDLATKVARA